MGRPVIDLTGCKFGKLTVIARDGKASDGKATWLCSCDCGKTAVVRGGDLKSGRIKSCGCLVKEIMHTQKYGLKHGDTHKDLYNVWVNMRQRINNPKNKAYKNYGGRGISICEEWNDYINFRNWALENGYRNGLSIDRIDVNGNYCPENCRWADFETQQNNKRYNRLISYNGKTQTITQWSKEIGINRNTLEGRLKSGWRIEDALTKDKCEKGERCDNRFLTYNGKTQTMTQWARELGMNRKTLSYRIDKCGWSIEKAMTTPVMNSKKKEGKQHGKL